VPGRVEVDPPANRLPGWPGPGGGLLISENPARGYHPVVGCGQIVDQDIEMNGRPSRTRGRRAGLERQSLAVRRRLDGDPSRVPLDRGAAKKPGPEPSQRPWLGAVEHDLPDPANGRGIAHSIMVIEQQDRESTRPQA
jgi:hypothetical protein